MIGEKLDRIRHLLTSIEALLSVSFTASETQRGLSTPLVLFCSTLQIFSSVLPSNPGFLNKATLGEHCVCTHVVHWKTCTNTPALL